MGGDHGPPVTLPACRAFLDAHPTPSLRAGRHGRSAGRPGWPRCTLVTASEVVAMDDPIEVALRRKRDSSMRVAISQVKAGEGPGPRRRPACRPATPAR
jgi:glycerol-3-phosphate acyltransferase PlsX